MKIIYRISPFKPDNPAVCYPNDKKMLVDFSHNSFLEAGGKKYQITYILDCCEFWADEFEKYGKVINITSKNKNESLLKAYEIAEGDTLFVEDDYLWRPNTIDKIEFALFTLPVLSPYDHPAHYMEERFDKHFELKLIRNDVYRTCPSNTHTFAIRGDVFKKNAAMMIAYGVNDHEMFTELNKDAQMWCPTHSFATHLASNCLAPNVDWPLP